MTTTLDALLAEWDDAHGGPAGWSGAEADEHHLLTKAAHPETEAALLAQAVAAGRDGAR